MVAMAVNLRGEPARSQPFLESPQSPPKKECKPRNTQKYTNGISFFGWFVCFVVPSVCYLGTLLAPAYFCACIWRLPILGEDLGSQFPGGWLTLIESRVIKPNSEVTCGVADASRCSADIPVCGFAGLSSPVFPCGNWRLESRQNPQAGKPALRALRHSISEFGIKPPRIVAAAARRRIFPTESPGPVRLRTSAATV